MASRILRLTLAYDGTELVGWQRQAEGTSVQGLLEEALARIEGGAVTVHGAGRTDAGVHALGQVASVAVTFDLDPLAVRRALNGTLPASVRVLAVEDAPSAFHARYAASAKTYHYRIVCGETISPFERRYAWHVRQPLDVESMAAAAAKLEGEFDFSAFQAAGSSVATATRRLFRSVVHESSFDRPVAVEGPAERRIVYEARGDGFLRHMIRNIVGTLVEVGTGRRSADGVAAVLGSRDRSRAGPTAPAHGLFLVAVEYAAPAAHGAPADDDDAA